jgi:hypothetical protein
MKTAEVRIGHEYLYNGNVVTVIMRNSHPTKKVEYLSGICPTGFRGKQKTFTLSNGKNVKADKLKPITNDTNQ